MTTNDCIEKRAAFNALWGVFCGADEDGKRIVGECFKAVEALPTAQPQTKTTLWEATGVRAFCSNCGGAIPVMRSLDYKYCPYCGAMAKGAATDEV